MHFSNYLINLLQIVFLKFGVMQVKVKAVQVLKGMAHIFVVLFLLRESWLTLCTLGVNNAALQIEQIILSDDFHHPSRHTKSFQRLYDVVCLLGLYIKYYIQEKCKYLFLWEMNMRFPPFSYQEYMISSYDIIGFSN